MIHFRTFEDLHRACQALPVADEAALQSARARQDILTKPPGSLGQLETLAPWLAGWQRRAAPRLKQVRVLVFAGNHGVAAQGVSPYPASVTAQMVENFKSGGAAINQLALVANATLDVVPLALNRPTADFTRAPALREDAFLDAVQIGYEAVPPDTDLLCLGEMGIGNTTIAAALSAALFGGTGAEWAGRGTGAGDAILRRKQEIIDAGLKRHAALQDNPLALAAALGGRETAALLGAVLAARHRHVPVLLDGFVVTASAAPLWKVNPSALAHCALGHLSAEAGHRNLAQHLGLSPLLTLGLRLGEASGATLAVPILRAAVACHNGMASFAEAKVDNRD